MIYLTVFTETSYKHYNVINFFYNFNKQEYFQAEGLFVSPQLAYMF